MKQKTKGEIMNSNVLKIRIRKLEWKNIRQIEDLSLEFPKDKKINLIQIQNGYGKTTTLRLLRHVFTGLLPKDIKGFQYVGKMNNEAVEYSTFIAHLDILEPQYQDFTPYAITLHMNHIDETADFLTSSPNFGGEKPGWHLPSEMVDKFKKKEDFVNLFIFDGETAEELNKKRNITPTRNNL